MLVSSQMAANWAGLMTVLNSSRQRLLTIGPRRVRKPGRASRGLSKGDPSARESSAIDITPIHFYENYFTSTLMMQTKYRTPYSNPLNTFI